MKEKLKESQVGDFRTWVARVLFQYQTTPHDVSRRAPCELLVGWMVKTPLDILRPDLRSTALLKQLKRKMATNRGCRPGPLLQSGAPAFAKNFVNGPPWSAEQVVTPRSASSLLICMSGGTTWHRHAMLGLARLFQMSSLQGYQQQHWSLPQEHRPPQRRQGFGLAKRIFGLVGS